MSRTASAGAGPAGARFLLPARAAFAGQGLPRDVALALGRADSLRGAAGDRARLQRHFTLLPHAWPVAALTRAVDAADAAGAQWLRADPAWIRPDINGARLFAAGEGLRLAREDADALLPALRPLFGDAGMPIDAPHPSRWYLRIAPGVPLPVFPDPAEVLGSDLGDALVEADAGAGPDTRRWRALLSEAQVVLHNHPWNARRATEGKPPVNSLWLWGAGALPDHVSADVSAVRTEDALLQGLALCARIAHAGLPQRFDGAAGDVLFDLRASRDLEALASDWLRPAVHALRDGSLATIRLDFADGTGFALSRSHRFRFWRRPPDRLA